MNAFQISVYVSLCIASLIVAMQGWWWILLVLFAWIGLRYSALPLIPLMLMLDAYLGAFYSFPVLTVSAVCWFVLAEYVRERLTVVESNHG